MGQFLSTSTHVTDLEVVSFSNCIIDVTEVFESVFSRKIKAIIMWLRSFLICLCQMAKMGSFHIFPQSRQFIFPQCFSIPFRPKSFEWSTGCIFWHYLLFSPHLCQPVKLMSDELRLCCCCRRQPSLRPAVLKRGNGCNGGRERKINLPFTKSSLVCLLSSGWVKPNWAASYTRRKVKSINVCVCVV